MHIQGDRQMDKWTDIQAHILRDIQMGRQNIEMKEWTYGQTDRWANGLMK